MRKVIITFFYIIFLILLMDVSGFNYLEKNLSYEFDKFNFLLLIGALIMGYLLYFFRILLIELILKKRIITSLKYYNIFKLDNSTYSIAYLFMGIIFAIFEEIAIRPLNSLYLCVAIGLLHVVYRKDLLYVLYTCCCFILLQIAFYYYGILFSVIAHVLYNVLLFLREFGIQRIKTKEALLYENRNRESK